VRPSLPRSWLLADACFLLGFHPSSRRRRLCSGRALPRGLRHRAPVERAVPPQPAAPAPRPPARPRRSARRLPARASLKRGCAGRAAPRLHVALQPPGVLQAPAPGAVPQAQAAVDVAAERASERVVDRQGRLVERGRAAPRAPVLWSRVLNSSGSCTSSSRILSSPGPGQHSRAFREQLESCAALDEHARVRVRLATASCSSTFSSRARRRLSCCPSRRTASDRQPSETPCLDRDSAPCPFWTDLRRTANRLLSARAARRPHLLRLLVALLPPIFAAASSKPSSSTCSVPQKPSLAEPAVRPLAHDPPRVAR